MPASRSSRHAELAAFVSSELAARADPERAAGMAAYLKSSIPCIGVVTADTRAITKEAVRRFPLTDLAAYAGAVRTLWRLPHREERHVAIALARSYDRFITVDAIGLYEQLVREGAWWDFVDEVAHHLVGAALLKDPAAVWPVMDRWIDDDDMWIRRTAIICQVPFKKNTDERRLFDYCLRRAHEREFFIQKAIGWALRQYARTAPDTVRNFVAKHRSQLSALSMREASKHL